MDKKIGINGFGRIGRAIFRILLEKKNLDVVVINDINPDNKNIAYQLKYDSLYGPLGEEIIPNDSGMLINGKPVTIYHQKDIDQVPWEKYGVRKIIDSSGIKENVIRARNLRERGLEQVVITHSPDEKYLDRSVIMGVNEEEVDIKKDFIISSSICDAIAFAPTIKLLHEAYGIDWGSLTTLHPWLQNQNLLDGPSISWSEPGNVYAEYPLGRATPFSIMIKPTTTIISACKVLKFLNGKFNAFSYRVPTASVCSSDLSVKLTKKATTEEVRELFRNAKKNQKLKIFDINTQPLVSIDFKKTEYSAIIDEKWTTVNDGNLLKLVSWYDNEWGYSCRVVDLMDYLFSKG